MVEDQEAGVHAMAPAHQAHVDRMAVAAKVPAGLEQRDRR